MVEFPPKNGKGFSAKKKESNSPLKSNYFLETKNPNRRAVDKKFS